MNIRLVGISYSVPRISGVTYRLPKITDIELWENHRILELRDYVNVKDTLIKFYSLLRVSDSAVAWSQCLVAKPPVMDTVSVSEMLTIAKKYRRTFRDSVVPNSSIVFGMDKYLKDVVSASDKVSIQFTKMQSDFVSIYDTTDLFLTAIIPVADYLDTADSFRFETDKNIAELIDAADTIYKDIGRDGFADTTSSNDGIALSFSKKLIDSVSIADYIEILWSRSASSMYGQSTYGGATFGG